MFTVKNYLNYAGVCALLGAASMFTSCDSFYEDLAPCTGTRSALKFVFDNNMDEVDAFSKKVHSVHVFGFDQNDILAFEFEEKGDVLKMQGYTLPLTGVAPGEYTVVAWCGLDNDDATRGESFYVSDTEIGKTTRQELVCRMEREIINGEHYSRQQLFDLFHGPSYGVVVYDENDKENQGDFVYQVNLTKDTNNVRIMLQQMNKDVDVNDFYFRIEEANGTLNSDNNLEKEDEMINYEPFNKFDAVAGTVEGVTRAEGAIEGLSCAVADLKMSRLMARRESVLTIRNTSGDRVLQIPMTNYALMIRPFEASSLTDQEYLDRQDNYILMFFLDSEGKWDETQILINNWAVVKQDGSVKGNEL